MRHVKQPLPPPLSYSWHHQKTPGITSINRDVWPYGERPPDGPRSLICAWCGPTDDRGGVLVASEVLYVCLGCLESL